MSSDIEIDGTHGTSVSRVASIQQEGFKPTNGRLGVGIYFWSKSIYSEYLACSWWRQQYEKGGYRDDKNTACGIINAKFRLEEKYFLDLNDKILKEKLAVICQEQNIKYRTDARQCAAVISLFVKKLEDKFNRQFKLLEMPVAPPDPKYAPNY
ncbi:MAG: hypothetical protein WBM35_10980, partial [Candidatus Electrothrix sp.]